MIMDLDKERGRGRAAGFPSISLEGTIENIRNDPYDLSRIPRHPLCDASRALFDIAPSCSGYLSVTYRGNSCGRGGDDFETGERRGMIRYRSVSRELSG